MREEESNSYWLGYLVSATAYVANDLRYLISQWDQEPDQARLSKLKALTDRLDSNMSQIPYARKIQESLHA